MEFQAELESLQVRANLYIEKYLEHHLEKTSIHGLSALQQACRYALQGGGNRFRPSVCMLTARALGKDPNLVLGWGTAIEFIHSYSLVHDDLPCMDDDNFRRGKPSTHIAFGEAFGVLSGDVLNTEAFQVLIDAYKDQPELCLKLVQRLALAAGMKGMAGGQAIDMEIRSSNLDISALEDLYRRKTGALLYQSVMGSALICGANEAEMAALEKYADVLGVLFQISDDLLDFNSKSEEPCIVKLLGVEAARARCEKLFEESTQALQVLGEKAQGLQNLMAFIYKRTI